MRFKFDEVTSSREGVVRFIEKLELGVGLVVDGDCENLSLW